MVDDDKFIDDRSPDFPKNEGFEKFNAFLSDVLGTVLNLLEDHTTIENPGVTIIINFGDGEAGIIASTIEDIGGIHAVLSSAYTRFKARGS